MEPSQFDYEAALKKLRVLLDAPETSANGRLLVDLVFNLDEYEKKQVPAEKRQLKNLLALNRKSGLLRHFMDLCRQFLNWDQNNNYDFYTNGERTLLINLASCGIRTVFDVGANVGEWAFMAQEVLPEAMINCFEIVPETCVKLHMKAKGNSRIVVNPFGLSNEEGKVSVKHYPGESKLSSLLDYPHPFEHLMLEGRVTTGDLYLEQAGIAHVDFLKIDVEGMEGMVLQGFEKALAGRRVSAVQFEYGAANILSKFLLKDLYCIFERHGYRVGKIYPGYVDFKAYQLEDENFVGSNYLALSPLCVNWMELI